MAAGGAGCVALQQKTNSISLAQHCLAREKSEATTDTWIAIRLRGGIKEAADRVRVPARLLPPNKVHEPKWLPLSACRRVMD